MAKLCRLKLSPKFVLFIKEGVFKGEGGVPWVQTMENEFECLTDRGVMVVI